jgi:hypothetical protein
LYEGVASTFGLGDLPIDFSVPHTTTDFELMSDVTADIQNPDHDGLLTVFLNNTAVLSPNATNLSTDAFITGNMEPVTCDHDVATLDALPFMVVSLEPSNATQETN